MIDEEEQELQRYNELYRRQIETEEEWSEGKKWRERLDNLFFARKIDYWIPADSTRSDFWWLGVRLDYVARLLF